MPIKIAVGLDRAGWYQKFVEAVCLQKNSGFDIDAVIVDFEKQDWLDHIQDVQAVLWNPHYMGLRLAGHYKEKMYFIEKILGKIVFPSFNTIWHFESKVAQNLLFSYGGIKIPKTYIAFNHKDALSIIESLEMPVVLKKSEGASSKNVKLIFSKKWLKNYAEMQFCHQLWSEHRLKNSKLSIALHNFTRLWFWGFLLSQWNPSSLGTGVLYLQEFIPNNQADLRITIIGDQFGVGFWRNNRPGDFRASGSGRIDYRREVPREALMYCQQINQKFDFDTMAYDLLFDHGEIRITEMSYSYIDRAIYHSPGYYTFYPELQFIQRHTWPQELWVKVLVDKITNLKNT